MSVHLLPDSPGRVSSPRIIIFDHFGDSNSGLIILVSDITLSRQPFWRDHFGVNLKMNDHFAETFETIRAWSFSVIILV